MLKKIISAILAACALFLFTACKGDKTDEGVSQLRTDILYAEADGAQITVYAEEREMPLCADGNAGERTPAVIVKIVDSAAFSGTYTIFVSFDGKEYSARPEIMGGTVMRTVIPVEKLPSGGIDLRLEGEKELSVTLHTALPEHADAQKALAAAKQALGSRLISENGKIKGEFFVRVLLEEGNAFWYVGYITEKETLSFLVSGDGERVLAEHPSRENS